MRAGTVYSGIFSAFEEAVACPTFLSATQTHQFCSPILPLYTLLYLEMGKFATLLVALIAVSAGFVVLRSGETLRLVGDGVRYPAPCP